MSSTITTKIEFAVQMTCEGCVETVKKSLENTPEIKKIDVNLEKNCVIVETTLPTLKIQEKLESTGKKVAVKGYAGTCGVAVLETGANSLIKGVVRFVQVTPNSCIIDGTIDGVPKEDNLRLAVHQCGDISEGCKSVGDIFSPLPCSGRIYGDLGNIKAESNGRASFRFEDNIINLNSIIGRSLVLQDSAKKNVVCGIIARSAGLFENPKMICACDGISIWNERVKPAQ